jgi:hypothetical protein
MKSIAVSAAFSIVASVVCEVAADTVLWHRFDDRAPGESAQHSDVLTNAVSDAYGSGAAYSIDKGTSFVDDPDFMPKYEKPLFVGHIYDPVTEMAYTNRSSISFRTAGTSSALAGGAVCIPTSAEFVLTNFTVECFVYTTGGVFNTIAPIAGKPNGSFFGESWQIGMLTNGKLFMRYNKTHSDTSGDGTHDIDDGIWHHVAMTCSYDKERNESIYRMYVDYELDFEKKHAGATEYGVNSGDNYNIYVGGYLHEGRKFNGAVDELRISDTALEPDKFLRRTVPDIVDDDTLVWLSLDGEADAEVTEHELNRIVVLGDKGGFGSNVKLYRRGDVPSSLFSSDVPSPTVRTDQSIPPSIVNVTSFHVQTNGTAGSGSSLKLPKYPYSSTNFTVEMFFKTAGKMKSGESQTLFKFVIGPVLQATLNDAHPGKIIFVYCNMFGGKESPGQWTNAGYHGANLDDGKWHHVAAVYDADNMKLSLYIDRVMMWSGDGVQLTQTPSEIFVGSQESATKQFFHGWIDSVRVTGRALQPDEFIDRTSSVFSGPEDVVFHSSLNGNYEAVSPTGVMTGYGAARSYEGCRVPVFTNEVKYAELLLDGKDGSNSVTNDGALFLDGSHVCYPSVDGVGDYDQTVEFFCKLSYLGELSGLVRLNNNPTEPGGAPLWAIYANENANRVIRFRCSMITNGYHSSDRYLTSTVPSSALTDDQWHHVAATFEYEEERDREKISLYIDGEMEWSSTLAGKLSPLSGGHCVAAGVTVRENGNTKGIIDEIRITRGVLTPDRFLCRYRRPRGTVLIFR